MTDDSRNWLMLVLLFAGGWLIYLLAPVITPFAVSAGLAYLGDPLVDRLERVKIFRWKFSRTLAVSLVFLLMLMSLALVLVLLIPMLVEQVSLLIERLPQWIEWLSGTALPWIAAKVGLEMDSLDLGQFSGVLQSYWKEISSTTFRVIDLISRGGLALAAWLANLVLIPVVTFYLLRDWDGLKQGVRDLLPRNIEGETSRLAGEIDAVLGAFIRGQLMVMLALGVIYSIGLSLVGVELAVLIGMGAGLLSIVPYLGTIIGIVAAAVAAVFQFQDLFHLLMALLVFVVGQMAESMFLTPKLVGDRIGLHPVTVIFAVLAGGHLFGFLGILLALPAAAALNVLVREMHSKYRSSGMYESKRIV